MELASKLLFWTNDKKFGKNVLTDSETGDVMTVGEGKEVGTLNTISGAIPQFQNLVNSWKDQVDTTTSHFDVNTGGNLPSGTPYRLAAIQNQEANSHFVYRLEEAGTFVEEIFHDWIMPHFEKKLKDPHTLAAEFSRDELDKVDEAFIESALQEEIMKQRKRGILILDIEVERQRLKEKMMQTKQHRYLKVPKDYFKNLNAKIRVVITNEQRNKAVLLESLSNILQTVAKIPNVMQDPMLKKLFEKIMEISGISPIEISTAQSQPNKLMQPQPTAPQLDMNPVQAQANAMPA